MDQMIKRRLDSVCGRLRAVRCRVMWLRARNRVDFRARRAVRRDLVRGVIEGGSVRLMG